MAGWSSHRGCTKGRCGCFRVVVRCDPTFGYEGHQLMSSKYGFESAADAKQQAAEEWERRAFERQQFRETVDRLDGEIRDIITDWLKAIGYEEQSISIHRSGPRDIPNTPSEAVNASWIASASQRFAVDFSFTGTTSKFVIAFPKPWSDDHRRCIELGVVLSRELQIPGEWWGQTFRYFSPDGTWK